eukprot:scaffold7624_cov248-Pinguiococcus_pyrenoidosus.AAC.9
MGSGSPGSAPKVTPSSPLLADRASRCSRRADWSTVCAPTEVMLSRWYDSAHARATYGTPISPGPPRAEPVEIAYLLGDGPRTRRCFSPRHSLAASRGSRTPPARHRRSLTWTALCPARGPGASDAVGRPRSRLRRAETDSTSAACCSASACDSAGETERLRSITFFEVHRIQQARDDERLRIASVEAHQVSQLTRAALERALIQRRHYALHLYPKSLGQAGSPSSNPNSAPRAPAVRVAGLAAARSASQGAGVEAWRARGAQGGAKRKL